MQKTIQTNVLIIGSGPAGYSAAIYAARSNLDPIMVTGVQKGGQLTTTTDVENYPGFQDIIQGPWLMEQMAHQAQKVGTTFYNSDINSIDLQKKTAQDNEGRHFKAKTIIIATGAQARWLGLDSENFFQGYGVSGCATCDGFFFKNNEIAVIGGGNTAVEEALYLTRFASKVTLIHRRDRLRAEKILQDRLLTHKKITVLWNHVVQEFLGTESPPSLTGLKLTNVKDQSTAHLNVSGAFVAIGHDPATEIFKGQLAVDKAGYILTQPDGVATNIPGVFAAGDVHDTRYRQAVTAAGFGCMAALEAEHFLANQS